MDVNPEKALLGSIMMKNNMYYEAMEEISGSQDFTSFKNRKLFAVIQDMIESKEKVDAVTVGEELSKSEMLDEIKPEYLVECINSCPDVNSAKHYAKYVKEQSARHKIDRMLEKIDPMDRSSDPLDITEKIIKEARGIEEGYSQVSLDHVSAGLDKLTELVESAQERGMPEGFIRTGIGQLDKLVNYIAPTDFFLLTAKTGVGKTTLAMNIADYVAENEGPVFIFTGEMQAYEISLKLMAKHTDIEIDTMLQGGMTGDDWDRFSKISQYLREKDIYIVTGHATKLTDFKAAYRKAIREKDCCLAVLDYIQLIDNPPGIDEVQWLNSLSSELMQITSDNKVPLLGISRTNKQGGTYGSSEFEFDCNYHLHLAVDWHESNEYGKEDKGDRFLGVRKARIGKGGLVKLFFEGEYSRFTEIDEENF